MPQFDNLNTSTSSKCVWLFFFGFLFYFLFFKNYLAIFSAFYCDYIKKSFINSKLTFLLIILPLINKNILFINTLLILCFVGVDSYFNYIFFNKDVVLFSDVTSAAAVASASASLLSSFLIKDINLYNIAVKYSKIYLTYQYKLDFFKNLYPEIEEYYRTKGILSSLFAFIDSYNFSFVYSQQYFYNYFIAYLYSYLYTYIETYSFEFVEFYATIAAFNFASFYAEKYINTSRYDYIYRYAYKNAYENSYAEACAYICSLFIEADFPFELLDTKASELANSYASGRAEIEAKAFASFYASIQAKTNSECNIFDCSNQDILKLLKVKIETNVQVYVETKIDLNIKIKNLNIKHF